MHNRNLLLQVSFKFSKLDCSLGLPCFCSVLASTHSLTALGSRPIKSTACGVELHGARIDFTSLSGVTLARPPQDPKAVVWQGARASASDGHLTGIDSRKRRPLLWEVLTVEPSKAQNSTAHAAACIDTTSSSRCSTAASGLTRPLRRVLHTTIGRGPLPHTKTAARIRYHDQGHICPPTTCAAV